MSDHILTDDDLCILRHSLGISDESRKPYRNYYAADPSDIRLDHLAKLGMMIRGRTIPGGLIYYHVTIAGESVAVASLKPLPKLTRSQKRYRRYLDVAECFDSFKDWLIYDHWKRKEEAAHE